MAKAKIEQEIIGAELNKTQALIVQFKHVGFAKREVAVSSLNQASTVYRDSIESSNLGSRDTGTCLVRRGDEKIAKISYNGRVWKV